MMIRSHWAHTGVTLVLTGTEGESTVHWRPVSRLSPGLLSRVDLLLAGYSDTSPSSELNTEPEATENDLSDIAELRFFPLMGILDRLKQRTVSNRQISLLHFLCLPSPLEDKLVVVIGPHL